jgi:hypothetical protein
LFLFFGHKKDKSQSTLFLRGGINLEKWMKKDQTKSQERRLRRKSFSVLGSIQKICDTFLTPSTSPCDIFLIIFTHWFLGLNCFKISKELERKYFLKKIFSEADLRQFFLSLNELESILPNFFHHKMKIFFVFLLLRLAISKYRNIF